jgi:hypothetical protein
LSANTKKPVFSIDDPKHVQKILSRQWCCYLLF